MFKSNFIFSFLSAFTLIGLYSCDSKKLPVKQDSAYFGGRINVAKSNYVLFCKDNHVLDTLFLDENNSFGKHYDSLSSGMYIIKYGNNSKYVYFDKNDSLYLKINTQDFENLSSFYGRGSEKNNFLLELFAAVRDDNNTTENIFQKPYKKFKRSADSLRDRRKAMYLRRKTEIGWSNDFDQYAKAIIDYAYYTRLEGYSFIRHRFPRLENDTLPSNYFSFRKDINFNKEEFSEFRPFTHYLAMFLSSVTKDKKIKNPLDKGLTRIQIIDSIITNEKVKNKVLNNLAYTYLLEDQNIENNNVFLKKYVEMSNDSSHKEEIKALQNNINSFKQENKIKDFTFRDINNQSIYLMDTISKPTLIYFWSKNAMMHFKNVNNQVIHLQDKFPEIHFIAINIDNDYNAMKILDKIATNSKTTYLQSNNAEELQEKWIILRLNRAIYLNANGTINNGFLNIFDKELNLN